MRPILFDAEGNPIAFRDDLTGQTFRVDQQSDALIVPVVDTTRADAKAAEALRRLRDPDPVPEPMSTVGDEVRAMIDGLRRRPVA